MRLLAAFSLFACAAAAVVANRAFERGDWAIALLFFALGIFNGDYAARFISRSGKVN